jgi:hypothetical protein
MSTADRRIEQHTGEMHTGAGSRGAVLHSSLVFPGIGDEITEIAGGKVLARNEQDRLLGHKRHRREVVDRVIRRILVEGLAVRMGARGAEQELITVGCRT